MVAARPLRGRQALCFTLVLLSVFASSSGYAQTVAGFTPGSFKVTDSGAASYTIPIQVPPGVAGMEPKLAFTYNSKGGNGLLGMGWGLSGLSAITRCPRTLVQDGTKGGVNLDGTDRFCLDGQRLVLVSPHPATSYHGDGAEFRTERETFTKVISNGQVPAPGSGPQWFRVWTKAGQILEYGNTVDSRIEAQNKTTVRIWALNKISDKKGNSLTVTYVEDNANGDFYPSRIDYNYNGTPAVPTASVQFIPESLGRTDVVSSYVAGSAVKTLKRLGFVRTYVGPSLVKEYRLAYAYGETRRSRLTSVAECGADAACLPNTTFRWSSVLAGFVRDDSYAIPGDQSNFSVNGADVGLRVVDLNGDGLPDLLHSLYASNGWYGGGNIQRAYINTGHGFVRDDSYAIPGDQSNFSVNGADVGLRIVDLNGDGLPDLLHSLYANNGWYGGGNIQRAYINTGHGFVRDDSYAIPGDQSNFSVDGADVGLRVVDLNGDGLPDLLHSLYASNGWYNNGSIQRAYINTGHGFVRDDSYAIFGGDSHFSVNGSDVGLRVIDFNGDGLPDLLHSLSASNGWYNNGNIQRAYINTGHGFVRDDSWTIPGGASNFSVNGADAGLRVIDLNGDGLPDLLHSVYSNGSWYGGGSIQRAYINTGHGFVRDDSYAIPGGDSHLSVNGSDVGLRIVDLNGDGLPDLLHSLYASNGWYNSYGSSIQRAYINTGHGFVRDDSYAIPGGDSHFSVNGSDVGMRVVDLNGDAQPDLLHSLYASNGWYNNGSIQRAYKRSDSTGAKPDLLLSVTTGLGAVTEIFYKPLTNSGIYTKFTNPPPAVYTPLSLGDIQYTKSSYPVVDLQFPLYVVSNTTEGVAQSHVTNYTYYGLKAHQQGGGLLGFAYIQAEDVQNHITTSTAFRQDYPFRGLTSGVAKVALGPTLVTLDKVLNTWTTNPAVNALPYTFLTGKYHRCDLTFSVESGNDLNGAVLPTVSTTSSYDAYGNASSVTVSTGDGFSKTTNNIYFDPDTANWILGRIKESTVTSVTP